MKEKQLPKFGYIIYHRVKTIEQRTLDQIRPFMGRAAQCRWLGLEQQGSGSFCSDLS